MCLASPVHTRNPIRNTHVPEPVLISTLPFIYFFICVDIKINEWREANFFICSLSTWVKVNKIFRPFSMWWWQPLLFSDLLSGFLLSEVSIIIFFFMSHSIGLYIFFLHKRTMYFPGIPFNIMVNLLHTVNQEIY